jgi:hypothetical protein
VAARALPRRPNQLWASIFGRPPFRRQAYVHALATMGDAAFTVSLAGSLFFNVSFDAARPRILLYLVLTMAPFVVVAPLLGPAVDRLAGGPRVVIATTAIGRAVLCLLMAANLGELAVFPVAFGGLVLGKTYSVARNALVPRLVPEHGLVGANSRLARVSALAGGLGGAGAAALLSLTDDAVTVLVPAAVVFALAAFAAFHLPRPELTTTIRPEVAWREMHGPRVVLGAGAVTVLRCGVGFMLFLLGMSLKRSGEPAWVFGLVLVAMGVGSFLGNALAPMARRHLTEERIVEVSLGLPLVVAVVGAIADNSVGTLLGAAGVGAGAAIGRQAFDAVVQRETHELDRGRAFAGFDTRFQLAWVLGALMPVLFRPPVRVGFALLGAGFFVGLLLYQSALRDVPAPEPEHRPTPETAPGELLNTARRLLVEGSLRAAVALAASAALDGVCPAGEAARAACAVELAALRQRALGSAEPLDRPAADRALELASSLLEG